MKISTAPDIISDENYSGPIKVVIYNSLGLFTVKVSSFFGYRDLVAYFIGREREFILPGKTKIVDAFVVDID